MAAACAGCGATGRLETALKPDVPRERLRVESGRGRRYSVLASDYRALCLPCHRAACGSAAGGPRCKWGHEYTAQNTRLEVAGGRRCRTCIRRQSLELRARRALEALAGVPRPQPKPPRVVPPLEARILERLRLCARRRGLPLDAGALAALARVAYQTVPKPRAPKPKPRTSKPKPKPKPKPRRPSPVAELVARAAELRAQAGADALSAHDAVALASRELTGDGGSDS
jgi:hypothetical protein